MKKILIKIANKIYKHYCEKSIIDLYSVLAYKDKEYQIVEINFRQKEAHLDTLNIVAHERGKLKDSLKSVK